MMAEEEVTYSSVVLKSLTNSPHVPKEEETVYDEVKVREEMAEQTDNTKDTAGFLPDKKDTRCGHYQPMACCVRILSAICLLCIIVVCVYFTVVTQVEFRGNQKTQSQENAALKSKITNLTAENRQLESRNRQLETEKRQLETEKWQLETEKQKLEREKRQQSDNSAAKIQDIQTQWNERNLSRAQWSIDAYCPKVGGGRWCKSCQEGWVNDTSSCYVFHNAKEGERKTWEEAQAICKEKNSELVVVANEEEKKFISDKRWGSDGFWIGLRVEDGKWKWLNGSDLTVESWIQKALLGHCAISVNDVRWKSALCSEKKQWICKKKALSV